MPKRALVSAVLAAAVVTALAEIIGTQSFPLGPGKVVLFPIIWAILLGGALSFQRVRPVSLALQQRALDLVSVGIMVFLVLVGITVGTSLTALKDVTWVLALQEVAHLFGTVVVALPIAVALRMGRASIGATYSIDREANLAYTAERYGASSAEYRGTLGVYVFGSVFGALYLALLAGYFSSAGWLDPLALAMGSGVGSGSMMAAASAAIAASYPALQSQILAYAAPSNLMTQTIGTFVTCFIVLPLAERLYRLWCRLFRVPERLTSDGPAVPVPVSSGATAPTPHNHEGVATPTSVQVLRPHLIVADRRGAYGVARTSSTPRLRDHIGPGAQPPRPQPVRHRHGKRRSVGSAAWQTEKRRTVPGRGHLLRQARLRPRRHDPALAPTPHTDRTWWQGPRRPASRGRLGTRCSGPTSTPAAGSDWTWTPV